MKNSDEMEQAIRVVQYLTSQKILDFAELELAQRHYYSTTNGEQYLSKGRLIEAYDLLIKEGKIATNPMLRKLLTTKSTRSSSGIVVVSVLTKPYDCPGKCIYCPTEKDVPKSYLSQEPAVMRAIKFDYNPYQQTMNRLNSLKLVGHLVEKVNIRIIGGTFSYYDNSYKEWFIKELFRACNDFEAGESSELQTLEESQKINEKAGVRVVEISVETRQDYINTEELLLFRKLGVTKVELGVQSIYDDVLLLNNRGHDVSKTVQATALLRSFGFKVAYQMMLNLPGSSYQRDLQMMQEIFTDSRFMPDHLKIYPLALVKEAQIYQMYLKGEYKPYSVQELTDLLVEIKRNIPYYCRIERVIRDIPASYIVEGGAKISNLRQVVQSEMQKKGYKCNCIRCRESGLSSASRVDPANEIKMFRTNYMAAEGAEIFLSFESADREILYSILRLRINEKSAVEVLQNCGIIREIHTYGQTVRLGENGKNETTQHTGMGKKLVQEAERIVKEEYGLRKMAVIAGIGVREYFQKRGYAEVDTYMVKSL